MGSGRGSVVGMAEHGGKAGEDKEDSLVAVC